jgi:menaquinone-dependent protoporphyrinogen oxidase
MTTKILVTYASRTGSTAEVAERIAEILQVEGRVVSVVSMKDAGDLSLYDAVVVGSAVQNQQWLPEAIAFINVNNKKLAATTTAMFTVCMTLAMENGEEFRDAISEWMAPARRVLQPSSEAIFAGALNIDKIPSFGDRLKFRIGVLSGVWNEGDHRDFDAIEAWARELSSIL